MLLGTHTSGKGTDQLMIAEVMLPIVHTQLAGKDLTDLYDEEKQGKFPNQSSARCSKEKKADEQN